MIDQHVRTVKDRLLDGLVRWLARRVAPGLLTIGGLAAGILAGGAAAAGAWWPATVLFLVGRLLDGLDGPVARAAGRQSDLGGYVDIMADSVTYIAIPIGIAAYRADEAVWMWCALLLASFYVNALSWSYLSAVIEKRGAGRPATDRTTTVAMPPALVEGAETIVCYLVMLIWPAQAEWWFAVMAAMVVVSALQRLWWARSNLP